MFYYLQDASPFFLISEQLAEILCYWKPPDVDLDFYQHYVNMVLAVFSMTCRDLRELKHLVSFCLVLKCRTLLCCHAARSVMFWLCIRLFATVLFEYLQFIRNCPRLKWQFRVRRSPTFLKLRTTSWVSPVNAKGCRFDTDFRSANCSQFALNYVCKGRSCKADFRTGSRATWRQRAPFWWPQVEHSLARNSPWYEKMRKKHDLLRASENR